MAATQFVDSQFFSIDSEFDLARQYKLNGCGMDVEDRLHSEDSSDSFRGQKRPAEDELGDENRLTKRFHLLNLDKDDLHLSIPQAPASISSHSRHVNDDDDTMQIDDTKDKVYIHDLDDELADVESDDDKIIFIPDIERRLNRLTKSLLHNISGRPKGNELVLYNVPESLSVPQEKDSVRKAIIEARARIRENQAKERSPSAVNSDSGHGTAATPAVSSSSLSSVLPFIMPSAPSPAESTMPNAIPHAIPPNSLTLQLPANDDPDAMDIE